jgi:hypothetical protein
MTDKEKKVISGPWHGTPAFPEETVHAESKIGDEQRVTPHVRVIPTAPCDEFLRIVKSARIEDLPRSRISNEKKLYSGWSLEQLLLFVNNLDNHPKLIQKPVLVLALHELIRQKRPY